MQIAGCGRPKKGNSSSVIHVDSVRIVGWTEKSVSAVKARYAKGNADRHRGM